MIYLASPYSHPDSGVREQRYYDVCLASKELALKGHPIVSPIAHWHPIAVMYGLPTDAKFWWNLDRDYIDSAREVWVYTIDGWRTSEGVKMETEYAENEGYTLSLVAPVTYHVTHLSPGELKL
jgi:hypothetical protein